MRQRSFQTLGFFLLLIFALFSASGGKTLISKSENNLSFKDQLAKNDLEHQHEFYRLTNSYLAYEVGTSGEQVMTDVYGFKGKSVKRAFVYSLIIPGAGEFYAGSKIKAALFLGVDVALWALYFNYHGKGKDKEDEYEGFADQHWLEDTYREWWEQLPDSVKDKYSHTLPDSRTQQYYEMIGKYKQFAFAWDDFDPNTVGEDSVTPNRNVYLDLREKSNSLLNKAKYSAMFSLANHILSAFDAAIAVKKHNKKGERFGQLEFKMRLAESDSEIVPKLIMSMKF